jgi:hypothetical protein
MEAIAELNRAIEEIKRMDDFGGVLIDIMNSSRYKSHIYLTNYSREDSFFDDEYC